MARIRVTKEFTFDMAHALHNYDGLCRNIHGHTYRFQVTLIGEPSSDKSDPKQGMVIDFSVLKKIVNRKIVAVYDHALVINSDHAISHTSIPFQEKDKFITVPFQPTAENLVSHFAELIEPELPDGLDLHSTRLWETPTSFAEWYAEDNR